MDGIEIRPARAEEAPAISALVREVFEAFVAPHYSTEGRATFGRAIAPEALAARLAGRPEEGRTALVACTAPVGKAGGELVGYISVEKCHVGLLFVAGPFQRRGIARALLARAFQGREDAEVTVNTAPNSLEAYVGLGFEPAGPWTTSDGLAFRPMVRRSAGDPRE